ncbi:U3 small nucleolar RNA-associated protein 18 homolog [Gryllus bimaculatus]|nr:U3 small nucleolar RNA-associated protein 18 homolog [Gryllus bimaculatus]
MASICRESKKASKRKFFEDRQGTVDSQKIRKLDNEKTPKTPEKPSKEKEKFGMMDMDEEAMLEKLVLGDLSSVLDKLGEDNDRFPRLIMDTEGDSGVEEGVSTPEDDEEDEEPSTSCKQPAWRDEEDSHLCIQEALRTQNRKQTIKFPGNSADAYTGILQQQFNNIVGTPKWAQLEDKEGDEDSTDSDDEILQHCGKFISKSSSALPRGVLSIKRVLDLNSNTRTEGPIISAVHFHPKSSVALVAGLSGIASIIQLHSLEAPSLFLDFVNMSIEVFHLESEEEYVFVKSVQNLDHLNLICPVFSVFVVDNCCWFGVVGIRDQVDGEKNNKLHSVQFQRFPISTAKFTIDGNDFLVGSRELPYYYRYDMLEGRSLKVQPQTVTPITNFKHFQLSPDGQFMAVAGRFGNIYLLCVRTGECIATLKMSGEVSVLAFNVDGSRLFSHGDSGMVYVWDMNSRSCLFQFYDDGCISGTALALSANGQYVATGSAQGVVNVYESSSLSKSKGKPTPAKIIYNLTTSITSLAFNASSEMLAIASHYKSNAIRMAHFPSMTVFSNFPGFAYNVIRPNAMDFSLNSGYFSVANNNNTAFLFRLGHYGNF